MRITLPALVAIPLLAGGCASGGDTPEGASVIDSAGIEIVTSGGVDQALPWTVTEVGRIGGAESGPASFTSAARSLVGVDASDRVHVLDAENFQVHRFDADGLHLGSVGGKGGGPGEFEHPASIGVSPDGSTTVFDYGKMALVSWGRDGTVRPERRWDMSALKRFPTGMMRAIGDTVLLLADGGDSLTRFTWLMRLTPQDTTSIDSLLRPQGQMVMFKCVGLNIDKLFAPRLTFALAEGMIAATRQSTYGIDIYRGGKLSRRIRRDVAPQATSPEDAKRLFPEGMKVSFGGDAPPCVTPAEEVAEKVGMYPTLPVISNLTLAPDGSLWVERHTFAGETPSVDVFDPRGFYLGTLAGFAAPLGFLGTDRVVFEVKDEVNGGSVVGVFRISR